MNTLHFISGLPRSGTTLLSAILNQNPRFSASISGPAARITRAVISEAQAQGGYRTQCPEELRKKLIKNMLHTYYQDSNSVVFDTNRGWPLLMPVLSDLYPESKLIICVRDVPWVIDSFEQLLRKNPYSLSSLFNGDEGIDVYARANTLLRSDRTVGFALNAIKQAVYACNNDSILLVEYDRLCRDPKQVIGDIYKHIAEEEFAHDFDNVASAHDEFDQDTGLKGMHTTRAKVELIKRQTILPPDIWHATEGLSFWKQIEQSQQLSRKSSGW